MRKILAIVWAAMAALGCSKSDDQSEQLREVGFRSQLSRALVESVADLQLQEIKLYGAYTLDGRTAQIFDAERLYYDFSTAEWDYASTQYWISKAAYGFCAITPYETPCHFSAADCSMTISGYESATDGADLLYAVASRDLAAREDFSPVPLTFHHACAAVRFRLVNASSSILTDVRNVRLVGLSNHGSFRCAPDGSAHWTLDNTTVSPTGSVQPFAGVCTLPEGGLPVNVTVAYPLYEEGTVVVLPQSIYKSATTLHLEYIKKGDAEYAIRDIELGMLGGSTPTEWKAGEVYEYNLTITDNTITCEVKVVDWVDNYVDL